jgi:calcium-dependent protein kinase
MLCGHPPFYGKSEAEILGKISRGVFNFSGKEWTAVSKEAKMLIQKMLSKDLLKRPTAQEVWNDNWIQARFKGEIDDKAVDVSALSSLAIFSTKFKLQQATLSYIASNFMMSKEISELKDAFVILDTNGDGRLNISELKAGYANIILSSIVSIDKILENCDMDNDGMLGYNEFITGALDWKKRLTNELIESAFKAYDTDRSGTISLAEIKDFLGEAQTDLKIDWNFIMEGIDSNGDGTIDLNEFKNLMLWKL